MTRSNDLDPLQLALDSLPHGPEFRFLDHLTELVPGVSGSGVYLVREDLTFLRGHFPGHPIFPGVLLVEASAQLAGVVAQSDPQIPPLAGLKLTGFRNVKITGTAVPGQTVHFKATVTGRLGKLVQASAEASVDNQVVLRAELILSGEPPRA